jgi:hypothetical protein
MGGRGWTRAALRRDGVIRRRLYRIEQWSHPENCADGEACFRTDLRSGKLLAVLIPQLENLDLSTLRRNENALVFDRRHRADAALNLRKSVMGVFAGAE